VILRLRDLESRLDDAAASVWYEELIESFRERPSWLDAEGQAIWQRVQSRAAGLRQVIDRIQRHDEQELFNNLDRLAALVRDQEAAGDRRERAIRQDVGTLRDEIRRDGELLRSLQSSLQENHTKTTEALQAQRKAMMGTTLSLFMGMLIVVILVVILT
jgi:DNA repair exonuclease SbcCD ATPase subunit